MKDIARSVLLGAAMISPALLQSCKSEGGTPAPRPPPTTGAVDLDTPPSTAATDTAAYTTTDTPTAAPSTSVVRPRLDPTGSAGPIMPTRGFSGGPRVRA
jgi:hypothetical protein